MPSPITPEALTEAVQQGEASLQLFLCGPAATPFARNERLTRINQALTLLSSLSLEAQQRKIIINVTSAALFQLQREIAGQAQWNVLRPPALQTEMEEVEKARQSVLHLQQETPALAQSGLMETATETVHTFRTQSYWTQAAMIGGVVLAAQTLWRLPGAIGRWFSGTPDQRSVPRRAWDAVKRPLTAAAGFLGIMWIIGLFGGRGGNGGPGNGPGNGGVPGGSPSADKQAKEKKAGAALSPDQVKKKQQEEGQKLDKNAKEQKEKKSAQAVAIRPGDQAFLQSVAPAEGQENQTMTMAVHPISLEEYNTRSDRRWFRIAGEASHRRYTHQEMIARIQELSAAYPPTARWRVQTSFYLNGLSTGEPLMQSLAKSVSQIDPQRFVTVQSIIRENEGPLPQAVAALPRDQILQNDTHVRALIEYDQHYRVPPAKIPTYIQLYRLHDASYWALHSDGSRENFRKAVQAELQAVQALTEEQMPYAENAGGIFGFPDKNAYVAHLGRLLLAETAIEATDL